METGGKRVRARVCGGSAEQAGRAGWDVPEGRTMMASGQKMLMWTMDGE